MFPFSIGFGVEFWYVRGEAFGASRFVENEMAWTLDFRTIAGLRGIYFERA